MSNPQKFDFNPMGCNTYVYTDYTSALIVDSSGQTDQIIRYLQKHRVEKVLLAYTHGHFDHIAYGLALQNALVQANVSCFTVAPSQDSVYFGERGDEILHNSLEMFDVSHMYGDIAIPHIDSFFDDGDKLDFLDFGIILTPGHTQGSCCLYSPSLKIMFSGDTIFAGGGTGRTDLPGGSAEQLYESLQKISQCPLDVILYPGHGPQDTLDSSCKALGLC